MGIRVFAHRMKTPYGELDIVCWDGTTLCCIEVKARHARPHFNTFYSVVSFTQRKRIHRAGRYIARTLNYAGPIRYDLIWVELNDGHPHSFHWFQACL